MENAKPLRISCFFKTICISVPELRNEGDGVRDSDQDLHGREEHRIRPGRESDNGCHRLVVQKQSTICHFIQI